MNVLLGVTGSIAAYKAVDLMRLFQKDGHQVSVIMTRAACRFIAPLTFGTFSANRVYTEMFAEDQDPLLHIHLVQDHDLLLVAPATANILAKFAVGLADDLLSTTFLAFSGHRVLAPAMNSRMWSSQVVADNLAILKRRGVLVVEPGYGSLACRDQGQGRLADLEEILKISLETVHD